MKKTLVTLFITTVLFTVYAGTPSGYVSLNFQETKPSVNKNVVYVKPSQHYYMMYSGVLNPEIKMFNTMVTKDGTRVAYPINVMRNMVAQNTETMIDSFQKKLNVINRETKGGIYPDGNGGAKEINLREVDSLNRPIWLPWLIAHTENCYIEFNLNPGDSVYLLGRYGDSAKNQYGYVAYGENANGWYGTIKLDNGQRFPGYRVACENLIRGWRWLLNGKAKIVETQKEEQEQQQAQGDDGVESDPKPAGNGKRKTFVNGKELVTSGNGDTYITINNSNDNNSNNIATGGKGGAANANATNKSTNSGGMVGTPNPNYNGPTPAPVPSVVPYVQPYVQPMYQQVYQQPYYQQAYQQPYYGYQQPYRSGVNLSFGFNLGGGGRGCYDYNTYPRYNQPQVCNTGGNWPGPRNPGPGPRQGGPSMGPTFGNSTVPTPSTGGGPSMGYTHR